MEDRIRTRKNSRTAHRTRPKSVSQRTATAMNKNRLRAAAVAVHATAAGHMTKAQQHLRDGIFLKTVVAIKSWNLCA